MFRVKYVISGEGRKRNFHSREWRIFLIVVLHVYYYIVLKWFVCLTDVSYPVWDMFVCALVQKVSPTSLTAFSGTCIFAGHYSSFYTGWTFPSWHVLVQRFDVMRGGPALSRRRLVPSCLLVSWSHLSVTADIFLIFCCTVILFDACVLYIY